MTVSQLIAKLIKHPPDRIVCVEGYEGGYGDISNLEEKTLYVAVCDDWTGFYSEAIDPEEGQFQALVLR